METVALVLSILAFGLFCVGFLPCLGWLNWINIPFAILATVVAAIAMGKATPETNGKAKTALILSVVAVLAGMVRLSMGGGLF